MPFDPFAERDQPTRQLAPGERRFLIGFCVLLFGGFLLEVLRDFEPVKLSAVLFPVFWGLLTAIHEAGHAVAARWCGWRVNGVVVGFGRVLRRFEVRGVPVEIRMLPLTGYALPVPVRMRGLRAANAFIYFAGPGVELLLVGLLVLVLGFDTLTTRTDSAPIILAQTFSVAALMGAILNLIPHTGPGGNWSDGMGVLMSPFLTEGHFEQRMAAPLLVEAEKRAEAGDAEGALVVVDQALDQYPRAVGLHLLAAFMLVKLGRRGEALMRLQALSRDRRLAPGEQRQVESALQAVRARA